MKTEKAPPPPPTHTAAAGAALDAAVAALNVDDDADAADAIRGAGRRDAAVFSWAHV